MKEIDLVYIDYHLDYIFSNVLYDYKISILYHSIFPLSDLNIFSEIESGFIFDVENYCSIIKFAFIK